MNAVGHRLAVVGILLVPTWAARAASAQEARVPELASLLTYDSVRSDLGLGEGQQSDIKRILEERAARPEARREAETKVSDALQPEQRTRLAEIQSQVIVARGALPEAWRAELGLTEEQKERLAKAEATNADAFRTLLESLQRIRFRSEKARLDYIESKYRKPAVERLSEILTPKQRRSFERLQGKPFPPAALVATSS